MTSSLLAGVLVALATWLLAPRVAPHRPVTGEPAPVAGTASTQPAGSRRRRRSRAPVGAHLPDLVAILDLAVRAGCSLPHALREAADGAPAVFHDGLRRCVALLDGGATIADAIDSLSEAWGPPAEPLVHALADHVRDGAPLLPALERVAEEARAARRRNAEQRARRLPVLLLFPLVLCVLPAFGLLTVAPLVASTLDALDVRPLEADASQLP